MNPRNTISFLGKHIGRIVLTLNVIAILALWLCCISTWLDPTTHPKLSVLGIMFPIFVLCEVAFVPIWLVVNYRRAWLPVAALVPCIGYILDYCPISFRQTAPEGCLKVVSWNTNGFGSHWEDKEEGRQLAWEYLKQCDADIICLQESHIWHPAMEPFLEAMDSLGYENHEYRSSLLLTRLPIISYDSIDYETTIVKGLIGNGSIAYRLKLDGDTITVVNNHLESNRLKDSLKTEYVESLDNTEYNKMKQSGRTIASRLANSVALRGPQVDSLVAFVNRPENKNIILCGDFNDTPISYTYQTLKGHLTSAYRQSGRGIGLSYNQRGFWVRIDHIFVGKPWQTYNTHIDNAIAVSDHFPIVSWLKME